MGFKIKKSILAGTSGYKKALTKLNRSIDKSSNKEGRAKSSAFQKVTDSDRKLLSDVTTMNDPTVTTDVKDTDTETTTTTTTKQTGENVKIYEKKGVDAFRKACYVNGVFQEGKTINGIRCILSKDKNFKETEEVVTPINKEDVDVKVDPKDKGCECQAYNAKNEPTGMIKHPCGQPHPNCYKRSTGSDCLCIDPQGKEHSYKCPEKNCTCPKPAKCAGKTDDCGLTVAQRKAESEKCRKKGNVMSRTFKRRFFWDPVACKCAEKRSSSREAIENMEMPSLKRFKNKCNKNEWGSVECPKF
tara:strand:+ start:1534 stop:2436 length:903 start_codon:yes stop_codon:yes gene_type:complete